MTGRAPACGVLLALSLALPLHAQTVDFASFYAQVRAHHPVARQARRLVDVADAERGVALGAFEPVLSATWNAKDLSGTRYEDRTNWKLTVPTPVGVDVRVGYDRASGKYVDPSNTTPANGLWSAGVSIPLGQRLLTDERRTALATASALRDAAVGERDGALNKLLLTAAKDFATWTEAERRAEIAREGVRLALERSTAVRARVARGDAAAIDTLEAALEVERREVTRSEAEAQRFSARLAVSAHRWSADGAPDDLPVDARPLADALPAFRADADAQAAWLARAERTHPDLAKLSAKVRQSEAQRWLATQGLLPTLSLDLTSLAKDADALGQNGEDRKAGVSGYLAPLLLKDRAKFSAAGAKLDRDRWELARVRREVGLAVRDAANTLTALDAQAERQARTVALARALRDGEQRRFEVGESSLLLVNLRERGLLDEELKLAALAAQRLAARAALAVAVGDPAMVGM